jgi:hypothetical protein
LNAATALTRDHHADVFIGGIIEGPLKWTIRPVAEFFYEKEFRRSETISGLVGLIWRVRENLSFDVGLRHALTNGHPVNEVRADCAWTMALLQFLRSIFTRDSASLLRRSDGSAKHVSFTRFIRSERPRSTR